MWSPDGVPRLLFVAAGTVGAAAGLACVVVKAAPHLLLKIPDKGWVLWAMLGNPMPPSQDLTCWKASEMKVWAKDGDVVVTPAPKCGTNWVLNIVHQIRTGGDPTFPDINVITPWMGLSHYGGQSWRQVWDFMHTGVLQPEGKPVREYWNHPSYPFRAFKAHGCPVPTDGSKPTLYATMLPRAFPKVKFIAMVRNGRDMVKSFYCFMNKFDPEWRKMYGGTPPKEMSKRVAVAVAAQRPDLYFDYVKQWWPYRHDSNVLMLHFSDAKRDLEGTIHRIEEFVGQKVPEDRWRDVVRYCGFEWMKENESKFRYRMFANPAYDATGHCMMSEKDGMIRKGVDGDSADFFDEETERIWAESELQHWPDPEMRRWAASGGPLP